MPLSLPYRRVQSVDTPFPSIQPRYVHVDQSMSWQLLVSKRECGAFVVEGTGIEMSDSLCL